MAKMRPDPKKGIPGGFILFILAGILLIFGIQSLTSQASGRVSFSHQAEHLTNLNLTIPEENRKVAQNENLVTFSGKFRDTLPEESVDRYRYLELLDQNHQLQAEGIRLGGQLDQLGKQVEEAADYYLHLRGQPLTRSGFTVVGSQYDTTDRVSAIVIYKLSDRTTSTLPFAEKSLELAKKTKNIES